MTALDELTREFEDAAVASAIIESLLDNGLEIRGGSIKALPRGYTGARLAKALMANVRGQPDPRWCVIKYCPPAPVNHRRESRRHSAALQEAPPNFREQHLTEMAFPAVPCPQGALVIGQSNADGIPLGTVQLGQLADACEVVWGEILVEWAGRGYDSEQSTLADLLACELGDSFRAGGWLRDWAQQHDLLVPAFLELPDEEAPLPNPWRLFAEDSPATRGEIHCLVGRAHGDLHGDNVLVPVHDGTVQPAGFRLIDLATYDARAPLSRDLAALLVSLCWREIGAGSPNSRKTFLAYLERDYRDGGLDDGMPGDVRKVIDALREPALRFVVGTGWDPEHWHRQLKVSLLAQAMLHSAYTSGTPDARRLCSRLAARLTRLLLGPVDVQAGPSTPFDAGKILGTTGTTAVRGRPVRDGSVFVDRTGQRSSLRAALEDQVTSVIVVSGPPGIGKTALVSEVLADLGWADPDDETSAVRWHDATPYGEIGVPTLIEDIEPPGSGRVAGPSARARLEIALDGLGKTRGIRPVIVLDSAENLLKDGHLLRDSELDLALEAVQGRLRPVVKVVFVTQHAPEATTGVAWTGTACRISLEGLEPPSQREHFAELDPGNRYRLAALPENDLRRIHGRLAGNPRLAELLHAVLSSDPPGLQAREVGPWLSSLPASEVHQRLVHRFVDHLPAEQQLAAKGLATLGIPVRTDAVIGVLEPYVPAARIEPALRALVEARLVLQRRDGRRYLRRTEIEAVLGRPGRDRHADEGNPPSRRDLTLSAAKVLQTMQKDDEDVHGMVDLDMHFARVDVWLQAGMYEQAHSLIESMDGLVRLWGSGAELRTQREAVRGRLGDDREGEMMNLAALGDIHSYSGDFRSALAAYTAALTIAKEDQDREAMRRIYVDMGYMFWEHDHLAEAEKHYGWALGLAGEDDDDGGDRAAALIGLADCRQRHGNYRRAVVDALAAFGAAREADLGLASDAALRLTRWYAELDQIPDALTMLARCAELIPARPDPSARAELLTSTADLYLYRGRYREAQSAAEQAVGVARDHRDPINLRRSLTTMALAHVHLDDLPAAREAIEESARYRVAGRETVELALRAIIAHRCGLPGTARDLFQQLHDETSERTGADGNDLAAWDFTGIARCHSVLLDEAEPRTALEAFRRARPEPAERTPGLDDRLRFMVETLADGDPRLEPVLTELARIRPGRVG
jgi:tetratricopeptide (TPR) repeat protein